LHGEWKVGRQTEIILGHLGYLAGLQRNRRQGELPLKRRRRC
jgi:hypothetical protein